MKATFAKAALLALVSFVGNQGTAKAQIYLVNSGSNNFISGVGSYQTDGTPYNRNLISGFSSTLYFPATIGLSGSNLYVPNTNTQTVAQYTTSGTLVTNSFLTGVTVGKMLVVDNYIYTLGGGTLGVYTTGGATVNSAMITGLSTAVDFDISGNTLFALNLVGTIGSISSYTLNTPSTATLANPTLVSGMTERPRGLDVSGSNIFVVHENNANLGTGRISEYTTSGQTISSSLVTGVDAPSDVLEFDGDLYVTCFMAQKVAKYTTSGQTVNTNLIVMNNGGYPTGLVIDPTAAPEPATTGLLLGAGALLASRRHRKR